MRARNSRSNMLSIKDCPNSYKRRSALWMQNYMKILNRLSLPRSRTQRLSIVSIHSYRQLRLNLLRLIRCWSSIKTWLKNRSGNSISRKSNSSRKCLKKASKLSDVFRTKLNSWDSRVKMLKMTYWSTNRKQANSPIYSWLLKRPSLTWSAKKTS